MKILLVAHRLPSTVAGGTERHVQALGECLRAHGHTVHFLVAGGGPVARVSASADGVHQLESPELFHEEWYRTVASGREGLIEEFLRELAPDVVHVHHWLGLSAKLVQTARKLALPVVVTLHDLWATCPRTFRVRSDGFCERKLQPEHCSPCAASPEWWEEGDGADHVVRFREQMEAELLAATKVCVPTAQHGERIRALQPGLRDLQFIVRPHLQEPLCQEPPERVPSERLRIGHWGHLSTMKGTATLLRAIQGLPDLKAKSLEFYLFGPLDEELVPLLSAAQEAAVVRHVPVFSPPDLAATPLDVAVFPSLAAESWSLVVDEAFALGLPVLAARHGAFLERIGEAGWLVDIQDDEALRGALESLPAADSEAYEAARRAVPLVEGDAEQQAVDWTALYLEAQDALQMQPSSAFRGASDPGFALSARATLESRLLEALGRHDALVVRTEALEQAMQDAERSKATAAGERRDLSESLAAHAAKASELEGTLKTAQKEYKKLTADRNHWQTQTRRLEAARDAGQRELAALEKDRDAWREGAETARQNAAALRTALATAEAQCNTLEQGRREAWGKVELATRRAEDAARAADRLGRRCAEIEDGLAAAHRATAEGERALAEARRQLETALQRERSLTDAGVRAQKRAREQEALVAKLTAELESEREGAKALEASRTKLVTQLEERLQELETHSHGLLQKLERMEAQVAALDLSARRGARAELKINALLRALGLTKEDEEQLVARAENLLQTLKATGAVEVALAHEARRIEEERDALQQQLDAVRSALESRRKSWFYRLFEGWTGGALEVAKGSPRRGMRPDDGRKRILFVIHQFLPRHAAGSEIYTYRLAQALAERAEVHVFTTEAHPGVHSYQVRERVEGGIPITEVTHQHTTEWFERTYEDPEMERIFGEFLDRYEPDLVHVQHLSHHSLGYVDKIKARGLPVVYTLHEYLLLCARGGQMRREDGTVCATPEPAQCAGCIQHVKLGAPPVAEGQPPLSSRIARHLPAGLKEWLKPFKPTPGEGGEAMAADGHEARAAAIATRLERGRRMTDAVDLFISPSAFLADRFAESGMIARDRIEVSANGQDPAPFENLVASRHEGIVVGYIGTVAEYKGVHVIVQAMDQLTDLQAVSGRIYGGLETFPSYADALVHNSQNPRLHFEGRYAPDEVGRVLSGLDVLVVPSLWYENAPLTIQEAFLAQVPLVVSGFGGMAEFVEDGVNGLHFAPGDSEGLAACLRRLATEDGLLAHLKAGIPPVKTIQEDAHTMWARYERLLGTSSRSEEKS